LYSLIQFKKIFCPNVNRLLGNKLRQTISSTNMRNVGVVLKISFLVKSEVNLYLLVTSQK
jgi:hypothetical protein